MNTPVPRAANAPAKSSFVTAVAWIWIAMSGLSAFVAFVQTIFAGVLLPGQNFEHAMAEASTSSDPQIQFATSLFHWFPWITGVMFLSSIVSLVASIGLLHRRNWGRLLFIAMLLLTIVSQIAGLAVQQKIFSMLPAIPQDEGAPPIAMFIHVLRTASIVLTLAFALVFGWIIKRLLSPPIAAEFTR
ncbi:hypothetical protein LVB87_11070 [Lysobacter sp. KIS68-7]|uniref:hypothetical protein n=1 Tax=Lysobacter sp. KIS68-7 TaxID=2904252 RepID=UPI001E2DD885|nr:hypothetical protein [Lysobacter sp. KIS68-7]UHQ18727.1 hypothetical protein LVB87_11070 [Lysobacter sp. KIS68-7]